MYTSSPMRPALTSLVLALAGMLFGCDGSRDGRREPTAPSRQTVSEISVRIDQPNGSAPSVSVLAFRASVAGILPGAVLGVVDPLVDAAPEGRCELRDVAAAARSLRAQEGSVDLQALGNVSLSLTPGGLVLRPTPRVYPQLAAVVGGVIGEAGPVDMLALPDTLTFDVGAARHLVTVPSMPRMFDVSFDVSGELSLSVSGPARTFLEIRPFGATRALACAIGPTGRVTVPHDLFAELITSSGQVPISVEAVYRDAQLLDAGGQRVRLSLETRSSTVIELR
jgi:hypothetical protein